MAGKEAVLILLASCWEGQVLARLFRPEDLAGIEPLLLTRHLSRKQFTLLRLKWSWPYLACLFVIHLKTQAKIKRVKMKRTMKAACGPMTTCLLCPW